MSIANLNSSGRLPERARKAAPSHLHSVTTTGQVPEVVSAGLLCETLDGDRVEYANFDHGASAPALATVKQAVDVATRTYSSVHRGNGYASKVTSAHYEAARAEVARFVGARDDDTVIFTRNTTDSFNLLAKALPRQAVVFVFSTEHHATLLPWPERRTVRLPVPGSLRDAEILLEDALEAVPARHRLVVLIGASNVTGELWPVERFAEIAHEAGARVAVDAAQLAPHKAIDLEALGADYLAFSGHKLYAPYGAGVLVGRSDWLDAAQPYLAGGGATSSVTERSTTWQRGAARHEAGSPNVLGAVALAAACSAFTAHRAEIEAHEDAIGHRLLTELDEIPGVTTYTLFQGEVDRLPVVTLTIDGLDSSLVSAALSLEHGIGVRDGKFCAHPFVDALLEGGPATAVRISAGLGTTQEHVTRLVAAVRELAVDGTRHEWLHVEGQGWVPAAAPEEAAIPLPW